MSILEPTLGELVDRYTILLLKEGTAEVEDEKKKIEKRLPAQVAIAAALGVCNATLWHLRDVAKMRPILLREGDELNAARRELVRLLK